MRFTLTARFRCRFSFRFYFRRAEPRHKRPIARHGCLRHCRRVVERTTRCNPFAGQIDSIAQRFRGLNHMLRTTLELTATDAEVEGAQFQFAAIPIAYPQLDSFDFRTPTMRSLFQFGYKCAQAGRLWSSSRSAGHDEANRGDTGIGQPNHCPADDEYIGRLAVSKAKSSAQIAARGKL
jgi:hypothetical protein